jgi:hypothetical protein
MRIDLVSLGPRRGALLALGLGIVLTLPFLHRDSSKQVSPLSHQSATADGGQRTRIHPSDSVPSTGGKTPQLVRSEQSNQSLPAPMEQASMDSIDRNSLIQSPPMVTEFPTWARKPSALDTLMTRSKQQEAFSASPPVKHELPPAVLAVDMANLPPPVLPQPAATANRYTPFADDWETDKEIAATALVSIEWPDHALQAPADQLASQSTTNQHDGHPGPSIEGTSQDNREHPQIIPLNSQASPGQIVAHRAIESTTHHAVLDQPNTISSRMDTDIQSRSVPQSVRPKRVIGAELRSRIPPSADLFIAQPSKK